MDVNYLPLLDVVAATRKPVLLSTGMATLGEIETALRRLRDGGAGPVALLHCVSIYPCPPEEVNLRNIPMLAETFDVPVGFSDHTAGVSVALAAFALGACILEKHFTIDKKLEGWDHAISADPAELAEIVAGGQTVFRALGRRERVVGAAETEKRRVFRRRAVARRALKKGQKIAAQDLDFKRPGNGIPPDRLEAIVGRAVVRDIAAEEEIEWADLA
jgi:N-acetylneuraminate synthase